MEELSGYVDVLLGRDEPPTGNTVESLMEYASAVYARACELTMVIQRGEREGTVTKGSSYYKLRTGELRTFTELAKNAHELGSRRVTLARMDFEESLG